MADKENTDRPPMLGVAPGHTRTQYADNDNRTAPDYCAECSKLAGEWVPWEACEAIRAATMLDPIHRLHEAERLAADYERGITWNTTCTSCAKTIEAAHRETERAEKAEQEVQRLREGLEALAESLPGSDATGYYSGDHVSGYREAERHIERLCSVLLGGEQA